MIDGTFERGPAKDEYLGFEIFKETHNKLWTVCSR